MTMQKRTIIKNIKRIINEFGAFNTMSVEQNAGMSPNVGTLGCVVGNAEYFDEKEATVKVYDMDSRGNSDPISEYTVKYEDLPKDVLEEIYLVVEMYEADQLKTKKRIS